MTASQRLADHLNLIARLLELLGEDPFRVRANQRAARAFEALPALPPLTPPPHAATRAALLEIDGVGPKIADKAIEFLTTGTTAELDDLRAKVPPGLLPLLDIPGLGPKTVAMLWQQAGVTDLPALNRIIADGSILNLPRMGQKAVDKLKASIQMREQAASRLELGRALPLAESIVNAVRAFPGVVQAAFAGSLRRGKETVGDLDILAAVDAPDAPAVADAFCTLPAVRHVLTKGPAKASVRIAVTTPDDGDAQASDQPDAQPGNSAPRADPAASESTFQCDLRLIEPARWGAALMYFTGSKEHNVRMRQRALDRGLTLNEYGLFPEDKADPTPPQSRGVAPVAARTEADVFAALALPEIPPELREDQGELDLAAPPKLIRAEHIKAELHAHTTASDGSLSIQQLAAAALARGFHTLAITDHSQSSAIANGLKPARLREHIRAIHAAREQFPALRLLAGSEVDILADGSLDYDDDLLAQLDSVVASPHAALSQDSAAATARLVKAVSHPAVRILGHPSGRLIARRRGLEPDWDAVFCAAKDHDVALEINAHWLRLDLHDSLIRHALRLGCLIAVNCDVHQPADFDNLRFGILTARRGGLTPDRCINTWPADRLADWLAR